MKSSYKRLGDYIHKVDERNKDYNTNLQGLSMTKEYRSSTSNIVGTDLSSYKIMRKNRFVCDFMSVIRVYKLPVVLHKSDEIAIVSPAYTTFEINDISTLLPEYLMLWFRRSEFDRYAFFKCDSAIRGGFDWEALCDCLLPIPDIDEQRKIVNAYNAIERRIELKRKINKNLESTLISEFSNSFNAKDNIEQIKLSEIISFGNGKARPKMNGMIPVYGGNGILSYTNQSNIENAVLIGRVGAYCGSVYLEQGMCWVSDNAIYAKSKISSDEYFDYFLLKGLKLFDLHVGTGQQLITQEILNNIKISKPSLEQIIAFNNKAKAIFVMIINNKKEIERMQQLSCLLLARLVNNWRNYYPL